MSRDLQVVESNELCQLALPDTVRSFSWHGQNRDWIVVQSAMTAVEKAESIVHEACWLHAPPEHATLDSTRKETWTWTLTKWLKRLLTA